MTTHQFWAPLSAFDLGSTPHAGGKAATVCELFNGLPNLRVPNGFVITTDAFRVMFEAGGVGLYADKLNEALSTGDSLSIEYRSRELRKHILDLAWPAGLRNSIISACSRVGLKAAPSGLVVRSSATLEDSETASFAGVYDSTFIGSEKQLLSACLNCYASLYSPRALAYYAAQNLHFSSVQMAILVQEAIPAGRGCSGVTITADIDGGFEDGMLITSVYGHGVGLVQGTITPDEFYLFKPNLDRQLEPILGRRLGRKTVRYMWSQSQGKLISSRVSDGMREKFSLANADLVVLGTQCLEIERHLRRRAQSQSAFEVEWLIDHQGKLWILQARPLVSVRDANNGVMTYSLQRESRIILTGQAAGRGIGKGSVAVLQHVEETVGFNRGDVLVAETTNPSWLPLMRAASAIVTERGGRTSHAAIIAREFGIPCVVGVGPAISTLKAGQVVTVSCIHGDEGRVYEGLLPVSQHPHRPLDGEIHTGLMIITGSPEAALAAARLPIDGIAMGREEFIIYGSLGIHPNAFLQYAQLRRDVAKLRDPVQRYKLDGLQAIQAIVDEVDKLSQGYRDKREFFVEILTSGLAKLAAAVYPRPAYLKLGDFKTNELRALHGGWLFEPIESNPMLGWRSASRYYSERYRPILEMECMAVMRVRQDMGLTNAHLMIPFCRTIREAQAVIDVLAAYGVRQHSEGLLIAAEVEVPSNVFLVEEFASIFDVLNIGLNDLTQMVLGVDRDSESLHYLFEETNPAVLKAIADSVERVHRLPAKTINGEMKRTPIGLTGVAVSSSRELVDYLVKIGIDYIGVEPDPSSVHRVRTWMWESERVKEGILP